MRAIFATVLTLAASTLFGSSDAHAGGVGLMTTGGFFSTPVYFYDDHNEQYKQTQILGNVGSGLEVVLGDRDNRIQGVFRGFWLMDFPEVDPATRTQLVDADNVQANWREEARHVGIATFGVQWGIFGDPNKFQLIANTSVGAGALTTDHTEFFLAQVGPGVTYRLARPLELYGELTYSLRFHKVAYHGMNGNVGIRYLFD